MASVYTKESIPRSSVDRVLAAGFNSSHFVWLISDLRFAVPTSGRIYAFAKRAGCILFALEPISPGDFSHSTETETAADRAIRAEIMEICREQGVPRFAFASVGEGWARSLRRQGWQTEVLPIAKEPWMHLKEDCQPRGNSAKGVRAARNQAQKRGVKVEWMRGADLRPDQVRELTEIWSEWDRRFLFQLAGYLLPSSPLTFREQRNYFFASTENRIEGALVTSPIRGIAGAYFEDLILRADAVSGTGEVLTLNALENLPVAGIEWASLGQVTLSDPAEAIRELPEALRSPGSLFLRLIGTFAPLVGFLYDSRGIELFRKRFGPREWRISYLCIARLEGKVGLSDWLRVSVGLTLAHAPRLSLSAVPLRNFYRQRIARTPVTYAFLTLLTVFHFTVPNHFEADRLGLSIHLLRPGYEWLYQMFLCDLIQGSHLAYAGIFTLAALFFNRVERTVKPRVMLTLLIAIMILDDLTSATVLHLIRYYHYALQADFYPIEDSTIGASYVVAFFSGISTIFSKAVRERAVPIGLMAVSLLFLERNYHGHLNPLSYFYLFFYSSGLGMGQFFRISSRISAPSSGGKGKAKP